MKLYEYFLQHEFLKRYKSFFDGKIKPYQSQFKGLSIELEEDLIRAYFLNQESIILEENEVSNEIVSLVIFVLDDKIYQAEGFKDLFAEGTGWRPTGIDSLFYRTDPPRPENQNRREICLAYKKNLRSTPQWTWYDDGKRKDKWKFTKEPNNTIKSFAASFFNKPISFLEIHHGFVDAQTGKQKLFG
ncbi:unnamed protein product [Leptospira phage LE1]|uniref:Uncharacterized protein n=1 Tax=Leptospira phage LE1 TaxID=137511 RepID=Q6NE38_9CAUD|nr:hypothetical protein HWD53_gp05 [Leptospira phage LE1]CAE14671.1 unnamed protein product [Leptospira phage LE1]